MAQPLIDQQPYYVVCSRNIAMRKRFATQSDAESYARKEREAWRLAGTPHLPIMRVYYRDGTLRFETSA